MGSICFFLLSVFAGGGGRLFPVLWPARHGPTNCLSSCTIGTYLLSFLKQKLFVWRSIIFFRNKSGWLDGTMGSCLMGQTGKTERTPTSHNPHSSSLYHQVTKVHLPHGPKQANTNCVTFSRTSSTMLADVENTCDYQRRSVYKVYRMRTTEKHKNQETDLWSKWHLVGDFFQTFHSTASVVKTTNR